MSSLIIIIVNHPEKKYISSGDGGRKVELHGGFPFWGERGEATLFSGWGKGKLYIMVKRYCHCPRPI